MSIIEMNKQVKRTFYAFFAMAFLLLAGISSFAQESELTVVDEVVAVVNDGVITLSRIKRETESMVEAGVAEGKTREQALAEIQAKQGEMIANMINEELLLQQGKELGVESDADASVNQRLLEIMRAQGIKTLDQLYEEMRKQNVDPNQLKDIWRRQYIKDAVMRREVDSKVYWGWNAKDIKAYYEKHKEKFMKPEQVSLSEIFLSFAGRDENAVRDKARMLIKQIREGADFAKVAVENSERPDVKDTKGSVGQITLSELKDLNPKFVAAVEATKVGGVSEPVEITEGIEIFRVDDRKEATKESVFDENEVRQAMTVEVIPERRKAFLVDLRGKSYIKVNDTYRPIVSPLLAADVDVKKKQ